MALFFRILVWSLRTLHFLAYRQCQRQARQARLKTTGSHPLNALFGNPMEPVVFIGGVGIVVRLIMAETI